MIINNEIFESFINCKYKAYLKLSGNSGNISEYEIMQNEIRALYKMDALKNILSAYKEKEILNNTHLSSAIEDGKKAIVNAHVNCDGLQSYCDLMEKISGKSDLGSFHYVPFVFIAKVQVYLDVEGDPEKDFYYLIGMIIVQDVTEKRYNFWADNQNEEAAIFAQFLSVLRDYFEFRIHHYGSYETKFLQKIQKTISQEDIELFNKIIGNSVNVLSIIYSHVFFPTYSNGLKDIGTHLGFKWSSEDASGISSLVWRKRWEINRNEDLKEKLIKYNLEDCLALKYIIGLTYRISDRDTPQENEKEHFNLVYTDDLKTDPNHKFKKVDYCFSDLEYINQCAYFDYQREKVFIHTNKNIRKANRYYKKLSERSYRIDKHIYLNTRDKCPRCGNKKPYRHHNCSKKVLDLKFSNYGAKRYITVYHTTRLRCIKCKNFFTPNYFRRIEKYGHGLISLIAYHHIATSQTFGRINEILTDLYGISLGRESLHRFKSLAAEYYQETYKKIINKLIKGTVIHVDETMIKIERERRYVWVFTNMEEVVFTYTKTREGYFLKEFLAGFKGVLISDFYAAYDSIDCPQQKCLIHLIRDLNEDVLKNPFDEEYKEMVQYFSILLREIIATVDKHGLKSRSLKNIRKTLINILVLLLIEIINPRWLRNVKKDF